jgi:hypothetical protein
MFNRYLRLAYALIALPSLWALFAFGSWIYHDSIGDWDSVTRAESVSFYSVAISLAMLLVLVVIPKTVYWIRLGRDGSDQ